MAYEISISKKVDNTGRSELSLRLRLGKIDQQASTHLFVCTQHVRWENYVSAKGRKSRRLVLKVSRLKTDEVQHTEDVKKQLDDMLVFIDNNLQQINVKDVGKGWLAQQIEEFLNPTKIDENEESDEPKQMSFFELFDLFLEKREISKNKRNQYKVFRRIAQRYEMYRQLLSPGFKLSFDTLDENGIEELGDYIKNEHKLLDKFPSIIEAVSESRKPSKRGQNTINAHYKMLRAFVRWAIDKEYITNNPFRKFKIPKDIYGTPYCLTLEDLSQLEKADLSKRPGLAVQRDIFVFQCCIGCRVSDLKELTMANVIKNEIHYIARKTKDGNPKTIQVPINKTAQAIIDRYADPKRKELLPFISDQNYNEAIKEVFKLAKLTRNVVIRNSLTGEPEAHPLNEVASSHLARRTLTNILYKKYKDQALVSAITGHAPNSSAFARYRDIDEDMRREMVSVLDL
ncbi:MAG: site-specific integrase [Muribaculaceae bacterium]|nr:site-specific integrase [Muribaculaceae bacterium]